MPERLTPQAQQAIARAQEIANQHHHRHIGTAHLFLGILDVEFAPTSAGTSLLRSIFLLHQFNMEEARLYAESALDMETLLCATSGRPPWALPFTSAACFVLDFAENKARYANDLELGTEQIFLACLRAQDEPCVADVLRPLKLPAGSWELVLWRLKSQQLPGAADHPLNILTAEAQTVLDNAYEAMRASYCGRISTLHLLLGLLADSTNQAHLLLTKLDVDIEELRTQALAARTNDAELATSEKRFTQSAKRALERAKQAAYDSGHMHINTTHIFHGLLPRPSTLEENRVFGKDLVDEAAPLLAHFDIAEVSANLGIDKDKTARGTSYLPAYCSTGLTFLSTAGLTSEAVHHTLLEKICYALFWFTFFGALIPFVWSIFSAKKAGTQLQWMLAFLGVIGGAIAGSIVGSLFF